MSFTDRDDETDIAFRRGFHWGLAVATLGAILISAFFWSMTK